MAVTTKKKAKSKVKLQPLGNRIVVERDESEETTAGGILLPGSSQEKPSRGVVISVGDGKLLNNGERAVPQVSVGDHILFTSYAPNEIKIGEEEYLLMSEDDVLAIMG